MATDLLAPSQDASSSDAAQEQSSEALEVIVFEVDDQEYCVPIVSVQEIIERQKTTRIPNTPEFVEGIINLRGRIIPILDARRRFGLTVLTEAELKSTEVRQDQRIVVIQIKDETVGLVVDAVSEVVNLSKDLVEQPPSDLTIKAAFVIGIGKYQSKLLILLDPEKIISCKEFEQLSAMADA